LEFALEQQVEKESSHTEAPAPSTTTSATATATAGDKPIWARGQHGRHKKHNDMHVIAEVGSERIKMPKRGGELGFSKN
jgi:hypothetical protein